MLMVAPLGAVGFFRALAYFWLHIEACPVTKLRRSSRVPFVYVRLKRGLLDNRTTRLGSEATSEVDQLLDTEQQGSTARPRCLEAWNA